MQKILIVDDDTGILDILKYLLSRQKKQWEVYLAQSVEAALLLIETHAFDTIISDVLMPGPNGFDLLEILQKTDGTKNIPVIMLTGAVENELKLKALHMGAADLLNKPVSQVDLIARVTNCLKLKAYNDHILQQNLSMEETIRERTREALLGAEISSILIKEKGLDDLLQHCTEAIIKHLDAALARIWVLNEKSHLLELRASAGMYTHINGEHQFIPVGQLRIGKIAGEKTPFLTNQLSGEPETSAPSWAETHHITGFAGHPLIVRDKVVGVMALFSKNRLKKSISAALGSISDGIALGIEEKKAEDKIHFLAFYDPLTKLPNRRYFYEILSDTITHANRYAKTFAMILIDLDNFNRINESLGHRRGDECLQIISGRLTDIQRTTDFVTKIFQEDMPVARMGGDEFIILLKNVGEIHKTNHIIHRIIGKISKPVRINNRDIYLSASLGVATYPVDGTHASELFKNAETALYAAKKKGKNGFAFYSQSMNKASIRLLELEADLHKALLREEFHLVYQPKVNIQTGIITGTEALIRWQTQKGDMVPPSEFIPMAEANGLILPIGKFVLETACKQNKKWQDSGMKKIRVAVNISGVQFGQKDFVNDVLSLLDTYELEPECLELEITETIIIQNLEKAILDLNALKKAGIKIAVDDFGTGYSSLAYLQKLPITALKIDISFIRSMVSNTSDAVIVKTIIDMARNLDLEVIAEGVEDIAQLRLLKAYKCDIVQGFLFSRPVSASALFDHIMEENRKIKTR